jgi:hypothetical protein
MTFFALFAFFAVQKLEDGMAHSRRDLQAPPSGVELQDPPTEYELRTVTFQLTPRPADQHLPSNRTTQYRSHSSARWSVT